jgi:hypothetical protein
MQRNRLVLAVAVLALVAAMMIGSFASVAAQVDDIVWETMEIEVAEDGNRFFFDNQNLHDDGMPAYGSAFVTQGYIYPVGTLNGSNGVLDDGSPEFPELVLGEWTCYGWMIGDGAHTTTGKWVVSTQVYEFNDGSTIITNGFELADIGVQGVRAISGGTGAYRSALGEQLQTLNGFTDTMGVNLSVIFEFSASPAAVSVAEDGLDMAELYGAQAQAAHADVIDAVIVTDMAEWYGAQAQAAHADLIDAAIVSDMAEWYGVQAQAAYADILMNAQGNTHPYALAARFGL